MRRQTLGLPVVWSGLGVCPLGITEVQGHEVTPYQSRLQQKQQAMPAVATPELFFGNQE